MPYTSSGEALGEGFKSGVSLVTGLHQAMEAKKQRGWENDLKTMTTGVELANIKGITAAKRMEIINGTVKPTWDKWHPNAPFPEMTANNADQVNPMLKDIGDIHQQAMHNKVSPTAAFGLITDRVIQGTKDLAVSAEDQKRVDDVAKGALDSVKNMQTEADKKVQRDKEGADVQGNALKRSTELGFQFTNLMKTGTIDPEMAKKDPTLAAFAGMFDKGKLSDEEKTAIGTIINHERQYLNQKIEDPKLRTPIMYGDEYKAAIVAGYKPNDLQLSHIIMPGANPAKAAAMPGPAPVPAAAPGAIAPTPGAIAPRPAIVPVVPTQSQAPAPVPGPSLSLSGAPAPMETPQRSLMGANYAPKGSDAGYLG